MAQKEIMLVGHDRFASPHIDEDVVLKHQCISVDSELAEAFMDSVVLDIANNEHPVWIEANSAQAKKITARLNGEVVDEPKKVARRRSPVKKAVAL